MSHLEKVKSGIICLEVENQIGFLTIDNGSQNKMPQPDFLDLNYFKEWISEQDLKGLIISGQGRHFSAGADIDYIKISRQEPERLAESLRKGKEILNYIEELPIITVAAISGICFGGGLEIALSCQFRVAAANAIIAFPESTIGILPGLAGTVRLPLKIGKRKALEMIMSGKTIDANEAYAIGLVDRVVPNKSHVLTAVQFINELTENRSQKQIRSIIQSLNMTLNGKLEKAMEHETEMFSQLAKDM